MKKLLKVLFISLIILSTFGCNKKQEEVDPSLNHYDVVLLTSDGSIYDGGFNENTYKGIKKYCDENELKYTYLMVAEYKDEDRAEVYDQAANDFSANLLIALGKEWINVVDKKSKQYPNTKVILLDGYGLDTRNNLVQVGFDERDSGFLAGYLCVKDENKNLAFLAEKNNTRANNYLYGFIMGAEAAGKDMYLGWHRINMVIDNASEADATSKADTLYENDTDVIFACGDSIIESVVEAAEEENTRYVVGSDYDHKELSDRVITSAIKDSELVVYDVLTRAFGTSLNNWNELANSQTIMSAEDGACRLPRNYTRFKNITAADFQQAYDALTKTYHDTFESDITIDAIKQLSLYYVNIDCMY